MRQTIIELAWVENNNNVRINIMRQTIIDLAWVENNNNRDGKSPEFLHTYDQDSVYTTISGA